MNAAIGTASGARHEARSVLKSVTIVVTVTTWGTETEIGASLWHETKSLAFASSRPRGDCHVSVDDDGKAVLWIGSAAFDLAPREAARVARLLDIRFYDQNRDDTRSDK